MKKGANVSNQRLLINTILKYQIKITVPTRAPFKLDYSHKKVASSEQQPQRIGPQYLLSVLLPNIYDRI